MKVEVHGVHGPHGHAKDGYTDSPHCQFLIYFHDTAPHKNLEVSQHKVSYNTIRLLIVNGRIVYIHHTSDCEVLLPLTTINALGGTCVSHESCLLALSFLHNLREDGGKKGSSHFDEKLSL